MNQGGRKEQTNKVKGFREAGHALRNQLGINKIHGLETRINGKVAYQCLCLIDTNRSIPVFKLGKISPDPSSPSQRDLGSRLSP